MRRWAVFGFLLAGMFLNLDSRIFAEDRQQGSSGKSLMGPKTPADYYLYQHGETPPAQPSLKAAPGAAKQPTNDSGNTNKASPGHWETQQVWVPGQPQEVWVWGHYDEKGSWVNGHSEVQVSQGHYEQRRVWIPGSY